MVLITGASGLIGSHLLMELVKTESIPIQALYRNEKRKNQVKHLFEAVFKEKALDYWSKINWVACDILDVPKLDQVLKNVTIVYHCAALVSFKQKDFKRMMEVNKVGTKNIINCCLNSSVKTFVHVSSTAALGSKLGEVVTEKTSWQREPDTSGYSISKYSAETEVWRGQEEGLNVIVVNPCLILGAGNWSESSLTLFRAVKNGLRFYTSGANAIVDVRDVVNVMLALVEKKIYGERYLVVGENLKFKMLFSEIAIKLGKKPPSILVSKFFLNIAWRIACIWAFISRTESSITRESAKSAFQTTVYSNEKILKELRDFKFKTLRESIDYSVKFELKD